MARKWPADEIPDSSIAVPNGVYTVSCSIKETRTKESDKLMYVGTFSVIEPAQFAGAPIYENFVIGSEQDPDADDPDTWKAAVAARIMKRVFKAAGLPLDDDLDGLIEAIEGQQISVEVGQEIDAKGKYAPKAKIIAWHPLGERAPGQAKAVAKAAVPPRASAGVQKLATAQPAPARPAAPAAKAPAERMLVCSVCNTKVPQSQFGAHVAGHEE